LIVTEEVVPEEIAPAAEEAVEDPKTKRLSTAQWLEIEAHCAYNTMSNRDMATKYGISTNAIWKHFKYLMEKGTPIGRGSKSHLLAAKTAAAIGVSVSAAASAPVASAFNLARKQNIENAKTSLHSQDIAAQRQLATIQKEIEAKTRLPRECDGDLKALERIVRILGQIRLNRWALLDIENDIDEAALPKLIFEDLNDEEIKLMQSSDAGEEGDFDFEDPAEGDDEIVEEKPE
jgi:biotin operon repressor